MSGSEFDWDVHLAGTSRIHVIPRAELLDGIRSEKPGLRTYVVDTEGVQSKEDLMDALSDGMGLPEYFGRNWDALLDVLSDFAWDPDVRYLILVKGGDDFARIASAEFETLFEVVREAMIRMEEQGRSLHVVLAGDAARDATIRAVGHEVVCDHFNGPSETQSGHRH